ncbi:MAG: hypothetical protein JW795_13855, partial [Chitinivibrionales bacterium]|nr:hypothetical protein [Chitinivibrionales bacterium]
DCLRKVAGLRRKGGIFQSIREGILLSAIDKYTDETGKHLFSVIRYNPKTFRQKSASGDWSMKGMRRVIYRLPQVLKAIKEGETIYIVEGEKDVETLEAQGLVATMNSGGAGKWLPEYADSLVGADVVVIPDNDEPGRRHAQKVAQSLQGKAKSIKIVELPGLPEKGDASDFIACGGTVKLLQEMAESTEPYDEKKDHLSKANTCGDSIRSRILEIVLQRDIKSIEKNKLIADTVVEWMHTQGKFYNSIEKQFSSVMFFNDSRKVLLRVQSDELLSWLSDTLRINRSEGAFKFIQTALETEGLTERSECIESAQFWAKRGSSIYLSNSPGSMIKISANETFEVPNGTDGVLFRADDSLKPWKFTTPEDPFQVCQVFSGMSTTESGKTLFKIWACSLPTDQKTKPPICCTGGVGSGKTRSIRGIFELFGLPEKVSHIKERDGENDFWAAVNGGGVVCFDNVDSKNSWVADALANAATAGSQEKRKLYSDSGRVTLKANAWVGITSANPHFGSDAGLSDRLLIIRLQRRTGDTAESQLSEQVQKVRDSGMSWIAYMIARALSDTKPVEKGLNPRHPDFADFAVRLGRAMGCESKVITALKDAENDKSLFCLQNDEIGSVLFEVLRESPFKGPASELLKRIIDIDPSFGGRLSSKKLSKAIERLWPHLEAIFKTKRESDSHKKQKVYSFSAGIAGIGGLFSQNPLTRELI